MAAALRRVQAIPARRWWSLRELAQSAGEFLVGPVVLIGSR
jgi:hypothetical protein